MTATSALGAGPAPAHALTLRVYYEDTDAGGLVYHANYLKFAERARTEMLRSLGFSQRRLGEAEGLGLAVRRCRAEFLAPARLDDALCVETRLTALGAASVALAQTIAREGRPLDEECECRCCRSFTRAYLRHLYMAGEILAARALTEHNLYFYGRLMREAQAAIASGTFTAYAESRLGRLSSVETGSERDEN